MLVECLCSLHLHLHVARVCLVQVRALEFHLAEARARQCDVVVTVGGLQSNHCRSTAVACRVVGMESHLLLAAEVSGAHSTQDYSLYILEVKGLSQ